MYTNIFIESLFLKKMTELDIKNVGPSYIYGYYLYMIGYGTKNFSFIAAFLNYEKRTSRAGNSNENTKTTHLRCCEVQHFYKKFYCS